MRRLSNVHAPSNGYIGSCFCRADVDGERLSEERVACGVPNVRVFGKFFHLVH